ncbi:RNA polymerase sigma-70 factor [Chengkuizengella axinellae]|uniref:RNA polymerase sigma-70 factor n=1 Tax=Chengkuizengella axinellae TaxID=3064388 RepID=A0ABT9J188_9BACL|nr:RNA polymerase sigma-70 factor [Chengkuizengella sp. 2205SS18-9]MDP5274769.1 RNA polymerase sigma-70 factor [Chengkuizengella sp. 2205SS18-9]
MRELFDSYRPLLFSIAYRMLGTIVDAEDIVQDTYVTASKTNLDHIENIKAYLCKMTTNRCLDVIKSARKKREVYVGPWLPEPLVMDNTHKDLAEQIIGKEYLSTAYLYMMEKLTPIERTIFILREALSLDYKEIAEITEKTDANCRKIFSRTKQKINIDQNETHFTYEENEHIVTNFLKALSTENTQMLTQLLSEDVILYSDGGGKAIAATNPIPTRSKVMIFLLGIAKKGPKDAEVKLSNINGQPGIIIYENKVPVSVTTYRIENNKVKEIYIIRNPDKLTNVSYGLG